MKRKCGVVMDPITQIKVEHDTTFRLLLEAQARDYELYYMELSDLFLENNAPKAFSKKMKVFDRLEKHFEWVAEETILLSELDLILMRKDPPVDGTYFYATQILTMAEKAGTQVINRPQALRDFNEKLLIYYFPQCIPPTLVSAQGHAIKDFLENHREIIAKPLHGMGGYSIFRLNKEDPNINVVIETLTQQGRSYMLAQRFIPEIETMGDKRILLIDGNPVPYALARFAAKGETRANMAAGGNILGVPLTERDYWICEQIAPFLREQGLFFVGIDVIGDYLTEINITSPTCMRELEKIFSLNIAKQVFDALPKK